MTSKNKNTPHPTQMHNLDNHVLPTMTTASIRVPQQLFYHILALWN